LSTRLRAATLLFSTAGCSPGISGEGMLTPFQQFEPPTKKGTEREIYTVFIKNGPPPKKQVRSIIDLDQLGLRIYQLPKL
jgi:hypothetical protein